MNFTPFAEQIDNRVKQMSKTQMYVTDVTGDELWDLYLDSFPEGTNEIFRERREHDCSCCKQFIREIGNIVTVKDGQIVSLWGDVVGEPYATVAKVLDDYVCAANITGKYYPTQTKVGTKFSLEIKENEAVRTWNHFHCEVKVPRIMAATLDTQKGQDATTVQVSERSFLQISDAAIETVLELIRGKQLYRGEQNEKQIQDFQKARRAYHACVGEQAKSIQAWTNMDHRWMIKNSSIGTLLIDLTKGVDLTDAVTAYEKKVAPENYKRSSALISKAMIQNALKQVKSLGLEDALQRRHATSHDIHVRDVLYVSRSTKPLMLGGLDSLEADLMKEAEVIAPSTKNVVKIGVDDFLATIMPGASKVELLLENRHANNLVSLIAPTEATPPLFSWGNNFSWAYNGDVTDSIKERVKRAGGSVTGLVRVSLSWFNKDDLDIHCVAPDGVETSFGKKRPHGKGKACLDVDMNVDNPQPGAVENLTWDQLDIGEHRVFVENYKRRESVGVGFEIEMEHNGVTHTWHYPKALRRQEKVAVMSIHADSSYTIGDVVVEPYMKLDVASKELWGIKTGDYHEVEMLTLSPNYWGNSTSGNKHWFFMLKGCQNPDPVRGLYNEFLRKELTEHRKVFEILGSKTMCQPSAQQLGGLGFSSTMTNNVLARVHSSGSIRTYEVEFNV